jgi:hypothetical protein
MDKRFQSRLTLAAVVLALMALVGSQLGQRVTANTNASSAARPAASAQLGALPASDFIIFVDTKRLVNDTLPNFLASDAELFARVNAKIDRFQKETGVDPRSFDSLAIGLRLDAISSGDPRFVAVAHGDFVASQLIDTGFAAAQKKENIGRVEEQYEGKTIYVLTPPAGRADNCTRNGKTEACRMAVTALDSNTIALGDLESVRATVNLGMARVDQSLVDLATRNPNAVAGFAGNLPQGAARQFGIRNGRADKLAASVRQMYGSVSTVGTTAESVLALRTETAEQAREIADGLNGLKFIAKLGFGGRSGGSKEKAEAFSKLLKAVSVNVQGEEVEIKLNVTQTDIAPLMRRF